MANNTESSGKDERQAREDVDSVTSDDSASEVESKVLGLDKLTGSPTEAADDARDAPGQAQRT